MNPLRLITQALLDSSTLAAQNSPRRRQNLNFHTTNETPCHRLINAIEPDSYVPPHRHLAAEKDESIIVLRGKIGILYFDELGALTGSCLLTPDGETVGANVMHGEFHSVVSLAVGSVFFEAKAGPYTALTEAERASWAPAENTPEAAAYLQWMQSVLV